MSLEELYLKVTNEHLPLKVRQLLPDPMTGYTNPEFSADWRQFEKVGEDQLETVKVILECLKSEYYIRSIKHNFFVGFNPSGLVKHLPRLPRMRGASKNLGWICSSDFMESQLAKCNCFSTEVC